MRSRLPGMLVAGALVVSACAGSTASLSPAGAPSVLTTTAPASSVSAPSEGTASVNDALFGTTYKAPAGARTGGTLVMGEWQTPDTLNPFYASSLITIVAITPALRGLVTVTSDGKYIADLADHIPTIANGDVVISGNTFTVRVSLKPGLKWSDGTALTLSDFKASWAWANDGRQSGCTGCAVGWNEIDAIDLSSDSLSASLHFKELYAGWLSFLTGAFLQAGWLQSFPVVDASKSMPVTAAIAKVPFSGPFVITNASKTEIDYARNPDWNAGVDLAVGGQAHLAYLDTLKLEVFGTKDGEIDAFKSGAIDLALGLGQVDYPAIQSTDPSVGTAELQPIWQYQHLDLNNDPNHTRGNGLWKADVRKAIAMAVNKPDLIAALFPGQSVQPVCSPTPPSVWYRKDETCPAFDVAAANSLLDSAGLAKGSDGNRSLNGKEIDLELCTMAGNQARLTELQKVHGYLAAVGLKSHVQTADGASVMFAGWADTKADTDCSIYRGNYDIADFAYVLGADPYSNYFYTYATNQFPELGDHSGTNDTRFSESAMDAALATLEADVDLARQYTDAGALQDSYNSGIPEIPLYYTSETTGVGASAGGWPGYNPSSIGPTWNTEDWYSR